MQEQENTRVVREGYQAFQRGDLVALLASYADDIVWQAAYGAGAHVPTSGRRVGKEAVAGFFQQLAKHITFSRFDVNELVATGDKVIGLGHYSGTTSLQRPIDMDFAMVFTLKDGKVTEFKEFSDSAALNAAYSIETVAGV